jgi:hypothetical protein
MLATLFQGKSEEFWGAMPPLRRQFGQLGGEIGRGYVFSGEGMVTKLRYGVAV